LFTFVACAFAFCICILKYHDSDMVAFCFYDFVEMG
jgi:hypothetical protein